MKKNQKSKFKSQNHILKIKTSDSQNEIFDIVDQRDKVVGRATRGMVHRNNKLIHRSVGVVIYNSKGEIFLQQRSDTKDIDPLKWTISCSGHVISGDSYEKTAFRELKEELGVELDIIPVIKFIYSCETETEMAMIYKGYSSGPFKLNKQEIAQGKFFTRSELNMSIKSGKIQMSREGKMALEKMGILDLE